MPTVGQLLTAMEKGQPLGVDPWIHLWRCSLGRESYRNQCSVPLDANVVTKLAVIFCERVAAVLVGETKPITYENLLELGRKFVNRLHLTAGQLGVEVPMTQIDRIEEKFRELNERIVRTNHPHQRSTSNGGRVR